MPRGRLPQMLDSLRISIDANGEIALDRCMDSRYSSRSGADGALVDLSR
jgi:hypothetical protein